jgi:hypothetical protein
VASSCLQGHQLVRDGRGTREFDRLADLAHRRRVSLPGDFPLYEPQFTDYVDVHVTTDLQQHVA